jgi:8-oxo-dGTP diphosphatase
MQTILTLRESDIVPGSVDLDSASFSHREPARAVVVDEHGQIALLWVGKNNYHKLPGGGIETGEDRELALRRELMEEIGCKAEIISEVGQIMKFRDKWNMKQTSYCYTANKIGVQKPPAFTQKELAEGFEIKWLDNIDAAIALLANDKPTSYDGVFIQKRDLQFLEAAKPLLRLR